MKVEEIYKSLNRITKLVMKRQLRDALVRITQLLNKYHPGEYQSLLEKHSETYKYLLDFTFKGVNDPQREQVYNNLRRDLLQLADQVAGYAVACESTLPDLQEKKYLNKNILTQLNVETILGQLKVNHELEEILKQSSVGLDSGQKEQKSAHELNLKDVFNRLWLKDHYIETEEELIKAIIKDTDTPWYEKSVFVSAITLSSIGYFEEKKIDLLIQFVLNKEEQVWQRALAGLILVLNYHEKRLPLYPELILRIKGALEEELHEFAPFIIHQLIKSGETEKLTKQFEEEIVPELIKNAPKLTEKLNLDELMNMNLDEMQNPDWQKEFFDNEDLYQKIEKFSQMQMDGSDVFMSAFSKLKNFSFFDEVLNWFLPFHTKNEYFTPVGKKTDKTLIEAITYAPFICNSDKYSFVLNIGRLPEEQFKMVSHLFMEEMQGLKADSELVPDETGKTKTILTQYLQDIYRFIKLFTGRKNFPDFLQLDVDFSHSHLAELYFPGINNMEEIAHLYFRIGDYASALKLYLHIEQQSEPGQETFQKAAYCYQKSGDYANALEMYKKAALFDKNSIWNNNKIAYCYTKTGDIDSAISYYTEALKTDPENLEMEARIARCYLDIEDFKNALKHYFKVEYLSPDKENIIRPIAWCYLNQGEIEKAKDYYNRLPDDKLTSFDLINLGHIHWCLNDVQEASSYYRRCLKEMILEKFVSEFINDKKLLIKNGISEEDIPLMLDYLRV